MGERVDEEALAREATRLHQEVARLSKELEVAVQRHGANSFQSREIQRAQLEARDLYDEVRQHDPELRYPQRARLAAAEDGRQREEAAARLEPGSVDCLSTA